MRSGNIQTLIGGKAFETESVFCDICGWGDVIIFSDILANGRRYDFCKRHTEKQIVNFIEMEFPSYQASKNPISNKDLAQGQFNLNIET